jgi:hypothetical protein
MSQQNLPYPYEPEFSFKKMLSDRLDDLLYVLAFKKALTAVIIAGALAGAFVAWYSKPTYTARLTFVVDDTKAGGGAGGLSAIAGQFGVNIDALSGSTSILAGDNIQELIKSRKLIKATLLTPYDSTQTLADKYAAIYKLNKKWLKHSADGKITRFLVGGKNNTRLQDSLLHEMTTLILEGKFMIAKIDKKLGFFEINTVMRDERLSQLFCVRMIKQSTDFFINTKTKRLRSNVERLEKRADSIGRLLNYKTYAASVANNNALDVNPAYSTSTNASIEVKERDKVLLASVYSETVKNLEASKTMLAQETPTVQIVDDPELPLKKNYLKYYVAIAIGILLSVVAFAFYILLTRSNKQTD